MGRKYSNADFQIKRALPLDIKIEQAKQRIREWHEYWGGEVAVSFSGGKDSTVLLHLVRSIFPDVEAVFSNTGLEYPEVVEFVSTFENVRVVRPSTTFKGVIQECGYPVISKEISRKIRDARKALSEGRGIDESYAVRQMLGVYTREDGSESKYNFERWLYMLKSPFKISEECCSKLKKQPLHDYVEETGKTCIIGTLADESRMRYQDWLNNGCNNYDGGRPASKPLSTWTEQDVLQYIVDNGLPIASVYGQIVRGKSGKLRTTGCDRTGCVFCLFGAHNEKTPNRFQRLKETHPKLYRYCMKPVDKGGLGLASVCEYMGIQYY